MVDDNSYYLTVIIENYVISIQVMTFEFIVFLMILGLYLALNKQNKQV